MSPLNWNMFLIFKNKCCIYLGLQQPCLYFPQIWANFCLVLFNPNLNVPWFWGIFLLPIKVCSTAPLQPYIHKSQTCNCLIVYLNLTFNLSLNHEFYVTSYSVLILMLVLNLTSITSNKSTRVKPLVRIMCYFQYHLKN